MSYLNVPRLIFAGRFQTSISSINNDPVHFDHSRFKPEYQQRQTGDDPSQLNGWFNPAGDGAWRLIGCHVTSAWRADGSPTSPVSGSLMHSRHVCSRGSRLEAIL